MNISSLNVRKLINHFDDKEERNSLSEVSNTVIHRQGTQFCFPLLYVIGLQFFLCMVYVRESVCVHTGCTPICSKETGARYQVSFSIFYIFPLRQGL